MAQAVKEPTSVTVPTRKRQPITDVVRSRFANLQDRLGAIESGARGRLVRALAAGNDRLRELDRTLANVQRDDFTVPAVRRQLGDLRARAAAARTNALRRVGELPGNAVHALASWPRAPIQTLTTGIADLARRIEGANEAAAAAKPKANGAK